MARLMRDRERPGPSENQASWTKDEGKTERQPGQEAAVYNMHADYASRSRDHHSNASRDQLLTRMHRECRLPVFEQNAEKHERNQIEKSYLS